jgi:hypothetical protein
VATCASCDAPLSEGQRFCRHCGAPAGAAAPKPTSPKPQPPKSALPKAAPAPAAVAATSCPSCGHPVASGARFCRGCGSALAASAVADRGAVASGRREPAGDAPDPPAAPPGALVETVYEHEVLPTPASGRPPLAPPRVGSRSPAARMPPPEAPVRVVTERPQPRPSPRPPSLAPPSRRVKLLRLSVAALVLVAIVAGLVFAATKLLGGGDDASAGSGEVADTPLPAISDTQLRRQIRDVMFEYHQKLKAGDDDGAFAMLSARKQKSLSGSGWKDRQAEVGRYIQPSGLRVTIKHKEPAAGVVQVRLTGMRYPRPNARCRTFSGLTWVKYENGAFHYDPGYVTTPQRERAWKNREAELLGGAC